MSTCFDHIEGESPYKYSLMKLADKIGLNEENENGCDYIHNYIYSNNEDTESLRYKRLKSYSIRIIVGFLLIL